jgi:hypothetical protein
MANPSIDSIEFINMSGARPHAPAPRYAEITRPTVDGHAFKALGDRSQRVSLQTVVDVSNVSTFEAAARELIGSQVSILTPEGQTFSSCFIWDVTIVSAQRVLTPVGGVSGGAWIVSALWLVQNVSTS